MAYKKKKPGRIYGKALKASKPEVKRGEIVQAGDTVHIAPVSFSTAEFPGGHSPPRKGRVAWVHPKGRFYLVEFPVGSQVIRECFQGVRA